MIKKATTESINSWIEFGLRIFGIWPNAHTGLINLVLWLLFLTYIQFCQVKFIVKYHSSDKILDLMDCLSIASSYGFLYFKLVNFRLNSGIFRQILLGIEKDWNKSSLADFTWIHDFMVKSKNRTDYYSKYIFSFYPLSVLCYTISSILSIILVTKERKLLLMMELPFDSKKSPVYEIVIFTQFIHIMICAILTSVIDSLILSLVIHLGTQMDIIHRALKELKVGNSKNLSGIINKLIVRHQRVISLSNHVENFLTYSALVQFIINTLLLCFIGFVLVNSFGQEDVGMMLVKFSSYCYVIMLETFIYCFIGEYISHKSVSISDAAYESIWYQLKPDESKLFLCLMTRSQKKLTITIGKFTDLSFERFSSILKTAASYIAVLRSFY